MSAAEEVTPGEPCRVAVVVPIHDVEQYLEECLASIAGQTIFADLDVVLVDDGSTDRSPEIAAAFAAEHDNVVFVRQENGGPGKARNRGLREVTAPLVTFCDSDDLLPPDAYETLRSILLEAGADVAVGDMQTFPDPSDYPWRACLQQAPVIDGIESAENLIHSAGPCNKLFRTGLLRARGVSFREEGHFEDVYLVLPALLFARRIALTSKVVYRYRRRATGGSIMNAFFTRPENFWDHLAVEEFLADLRPTLPGPRRYVLDLFLIRSFQGFALRAPELMEPAELRQFFDRAVAVYQGAAPDRVRAACRDARHRAAMVPLLLADWDLFAGNAAAAPGLDFTGGHIRLAVRRAVPDLIAALLDVDRITAVLETVESVEDGTALRVTGHFTVHGLALTAPLNCDIAVRVSGSGVTQPARNISRHVVERGAASERWSGFCGDFPARDLPDGDHWLRLVFDTPAGETSARIRPGGDTARAAVPVPLGSGQVLVREKDDTVVLRVTGRSGAVGRTLRRGRRVMKGLKHALKSAGTATTS